MRMPALPRTYVPVVLHRQDGLRATVARVDGELDLAATRSLRHVLPGLPHSALPNLLLDLRRVSFMDCSALGAFILARRAAGAVGGWLLVYGPGDQPRRLLEMTGLSTLVCPDDEPGSRFDPDGT